LLTEFGLNWPSGFRGEDLQMDDGRQVMAIAHIGELKRATIPKWVMGFTSKLQSHIFWVFL
jgi:hypothetical protein